MIISPRSEAVLELLSRLGMHESLACDVIVDQLRDWENVEGSVRDLVRMGLIKRRYMEFAITVEGVKELRNTKRKATKIATEYVVLSEGVYVHSSNVLDVALEFCKSQAPKTGREYEIVQRLYKIIPNKGYHVEDYTTC